ncbi:hypothetical protein LZL87_004198 [Fusarium oxysporum]|nr:hypothetical protein LZL87_004198 [Fusarium oxysporum]
MLSKIGLKRKLRTDGISSSRPPIKWTGDVPRLTIEGLRDTAGGIAGAMPGAAPESIHQGSEYTPRCYWAISDVLREAGLPDGCLILLLPSPVEAASTIDSLVSHPLVKKINFTGSTRVGRIISATAGKHLKPVLMELGGKASAIVLKDTDLE